MAGRRLVAAALGVLGLVAGVAAEGATTAAGHAAMRGLQSDYYSCSTCFISCSILDCRGENFNSCDSVYCSTTATTTPYPDYSSSVVDAYAVGMTIYFTSLGVSFAVCWVIPCFFMCCSINSFQTKEATLPLHMRTLDEGMKWAFVGATCCFGCVGWAIMHCVIQSRIDQQIMMVNAGLGGTRQAGMMQPQYVQPGAQMQMQQPQTQMQPQQYVVSLPSGQQGQQTVPTAVATVVDQDVKHFT